MKIIKISIVFYSFLIGSFLFVCSSCQKEIRNSIDSVSTPGSNNISNYGTLYTASLSYSQGKLSSINLDKDSFEFKWQTPAFLWDNNAMVYDSGIIYTGNVYGATAINAKSGNIIWTKKLISTSYSQSTTHPGNHPVLKDSFLYLITFWDNSGQVGLNCLDKNNGSIVWKQPLTEGITAEWDYTTPVVVGDKIIALSHGSNYEYNRIFCLNRFTGEELWRKVVSVGYWWPNPIAIDSANVIFRTRENIVYKVEVSNGNISPFITNFQTGRLLYNMNYFLKNNNIFIGTENGIVVIDKNNGQIIKTLQDTISNYYIGSKNIYILKDFGRLQANDFNSFQKKWVWTSPVGKYSKNESLFILDYGEQSFILSDDKVVYYYENYINLPDRRHNSIFLINAENGTLIKEIKLPTNYPAPILGKNQMVIKDEQVFQSLSNYVR